MVRRLPVVLLLALVAGCGSAPPPSTAISERQIRQTMVDFNVLGASGEGDRACALLTDEKRDGYMDTPVMRATADLLPAGVHDCASFWDWMGPRLSPAGRSMLMGARVSAVRIDGEQASADYATGGTVHLRWSGERWLIG